MRAWACTLVLVGCTHAVQDLGHGDDGGVDVAADAPVAAAPIASLAAGRSSTMALTRDGTVWAWGSNAMGELAFPSAGLTDVCTTTFGDHPCTATPTRVAALVGATAIGLGAEHGCALRGGRVLCWGANLFGQLGTGTVSDDPGSGVVDVGVDDAVAIAVGDYTSCAIHADGGVSCWGASIASMLGISDADLDSCPITAAQITRYGLGFGGPGGYPCALTPRRIPGLTDVTVLAVGRAHVCALASGRVLCRGSRELGQLGDGMFAAGSITLVEVPVADVTALAAGRAHTCALGAAGLSCWGHDGLGESGVLPPPDPCAMGGCVGEPAVVSLPGMPSQLGMGDLHSCVLLGTAVHCFGNAEMDACGVRNETCPNGPCRTTDAGDVALDAAGPIAGGGSHTCAGTADGAVLCWGSGLTGAIGNGRFEATPMPVRVELVD